MCWMSSRFSICAYQLLRCPDNSHSFVFFLQYLESVRPLLDSEEYNQMEILANDFKDSKAAQLQRYLILKSWWATNYVSIVYK